ncbi:MAG: hypothetical protein ACKOHG_14670, partial [Planctomycetia bacterium]
MTTDTAPTPGCRLLLAAAIVVAASSGCTSVIGSAYLREAWLDAVEHAAEATPRPKDGDKSTADDADSLPANDDAGAGQDDIETASQSQASWSPATLDEAVAEADQRLSRSGGLTEAARGTLVTMLEATPRQDWPVVIEEFTLALASVQGEGSKA